MDDPEAPSAGQLPLLGARRPPESPGSEAQTAQRTPRGDQRAQQSMGRKDSVMIPYIPPYEGPSPDSSRGLWTHLKVGWQKNRLKEAWGQWLGQRQSKQNVDSVLSPANPAWMTEFVDEAYQAIVLAHQTVTTGQFEDEQVKRSLHPLMVEFLREKRRRLLGSYSPSHLISWMKHPPPAQESELAVVAMRAAPFDQAGTLVQLAVRFRSRQSLEIRDERGLVVFGSHSEPQPIMEYFVFQKRMGQVDESFRLLQQVDEDPKPDCLPV
ncbi:hypothetical protein PtA15_2A497 [Puccinia triticina]|uniref:Tim44-like domain-containing protein n=1 Tax=Puccinia triticina TaxID=208348 RepID=A0ABY7CDG6_9BASI|nr:uncharacterized protein PtA15_2A497 [Puccinia triticina]WAQ82181.1 hypothetical protein PtA15_2A497 [Puccinia triticina]WAR53038.1 hypothetical protein PtB15_2B466 [Puccinia triticina]